MSKQLTDKILDYLEEHGEVSSLQLAEVFEENHQKIIGAIKSINAVGDLIDTKDLTDKKWELTQEGQHIVNHGSHEAAVFYFISDEGTTKEEIMLSSPFAKVGFSKALQAGWIELNKNDGKPVVKRKVTSIADTTQKDLKDLVNLSDKAKNDYKKRKLIQEIIIKYVHLAKGPNFSKNIEKLETGLTSDLLVNDAWKKKKFKPYNFEALGAALEVGHLHPLLKVKAEFRKIFLEMGFTEMPTNNYVESSFWNFDALFQPQQHPARDAHDTFFISDPSKTTKFPVDYVEKVKKVHSKGDYGSMGYEYEWKIEEAQKNVLRTHTTAVSARMLYKLMQEGEFKPVKYFSIDRVFRNETLDATHLAEFHQVEGVIADYYLTLGDLIGILYEFFKKLGITQLRFKPAYNPYTEPSMEIFCFHEGLGKWIELGNSGMFRPEMLLPMGFPEDVRVIAWGLSLERPTMIKYGINNVRDLIGPRVDMEMVHNNPICRLDKVSRYIPEKQKHEERKEKSDQEENHLQEIQRRITLGKQSLIVFCDPKYPIKFLKPFLRHVQSYIDISMAYHVHSSVQNLPKNFMEYHSKCEKINKKNGICLTIIWKEIGMDPKMKLPGFEEITGEINIARYLNRLIESCCLNLLRYESGGVSYANEIDNYLDEMHSILHSGMFKGIRKKSRYVMGDEISIVDIILESFDECKSYT